MRLLRTAAAALILGATALAPVAQAQDALSPEQTDAVKSLIREHLIANPEILKEAFQALKAKEEAEEKAMQAAMIKELGPLLFNPEGLPPLGNPKGDVTMVEFSDYNCGYCKRVFPVVWDAIEKDGNIKLHVLEYPILGPDSVTGARAALAIAMQAPEKYEPFHKALMAHKGKITEDVIDRLATAEGVDLSKMKADMGSEAVDAQIAKSFQLAQALSISGTPAFIVGDRLIPGAMGPETMAKLIEDARAAK